MTFAPARTRKASLWTMGLVGASTVTGLIAAQFIPNRAAPGPSAERAVAAMLAAKSAQNAGPDGAYTVDLAPAKPMLIIDTRNTFVLGTTALTSPQSAPESNLTEADKSLAAAQDGPILVLPPETGSTRPVNAPAIALMVPNGEPITEIPDVGCNLPGPKAASCGKQKQGSGAKTAAKRATSKAKADKDAFDLTNLFGR